MMRRSVCYALIALGALCAPLAFAAAAGDAWLQAREARFMAWRSANADAEARLPDLKRRTAALIAAYKSPPVGARYADLAAQASRLSPAQRAQAQRYFASGLAWYALDDLPSAKEFFDLGLSLDPTSALGNYHRADIYRREAAASSDPYLQAGYRVVAGLYLDRIATLAPNTAEAAKARALAADLPTVTEPPEVNRPAVVWRVADAPNELWDAAYAPPLVIVPAGEFSMGGRTTEKKMEMNRGDTENPRRRVRIAYAFAMGKYPVTRAEFAAFVADTGYEAKRTLCNGATVLNWEAPGYPQTDDHPVACMSYDNAQAYVAWLSRKTGHTYRLPSEAEWEYAARGGTATAYYWGEEVGRNNASCSGCGSAWDNKGTSPVGSFAPNPFGLYDMSGVIWQMTADCWNYHYLGAPTDGSPWRAGNCANSLERGGNFNQEATRARSSYRGGRADLKERGLSIHGFRVVREL